MTGPTELAAHSDMSFRAIKCSTSSGVDLPYLAAYVIITVLQQAAAQIFVI